MRLRSNAPLNAGSMRHRTEIATYSDGRSVGYDPRTATGFDVAGTAVSVNDVISYDRIGSLTWDTEAWREWTYQQVGLIASDDAATPTGLLGTLPVPEQALAARRRSRVPVAMAAGMVAVLVVAIVAPFALGMCAPPPTGSRTEDGVSAAIDQSQPRGVVKRGSTSDVPAYVIVASGLQPKLGLVGNVVISPPDAEVPTSQHKRICTQIAKRERFAVVRLFRTADAYVAMRDPTFRAENPGAIRHGFLGILMSDGTYRTAEERGWDTAIPSQ